LRSKKEHQSTSYTVLEETACAAKDIGCSAEQALPVSSLGAEA
jgi:hypothetical protein